MNKQPRFVLLFGLCLAVAAATASPGALASSAAGAVNPANAGLHSGGLQAFDLISENEGWLLAEGRLFWTENTGRSWEELTPPNLGAWSIRAATFIDTARGWLLLSMPSGSAFADWALARTVDGGHTWQTTPLTLFAPGDVNGLVSEAYLFFVDAEVGWLAFRRATSSNFSLGTLFRTEDGGDTWTEFTLPVGEPVRFVTRDLGWTAGGALGDELFRTSDGGQSWEPQALPTPHKPANARRFYQLPAFADAERGTLPAVVADGERAWLELYTSSDSGQAWVLTGQLALQGEVAQGVPVPLSVLGAGEWLLILPASQGTIRVLVNGETVQVGGEDAPPAGIQALDMATPDVGWASYAAGTCISTGAAEGGLPRCLLEIGLLRTEDGGETWAKLPLPLSGGPGAGRGEGTIRDAADEAGAESGARRGSGARTSLFEGQGFDKCEIATVGQLQSWKNSSPYGAVNLYIGGLNRGCPNTGLTAALVADASQQGWVFIPTWVGLQAPCTGYAYRMSYDPGTAYNQGVSEAEAAVDAALDLALTLPDGSGTVIYFDLEAYDTNNSSCREAVKSFMSGWVAQLRARENEAGVYGSSCGSAIDDFSSIPNVPDAIWPAHWIYNSYNPAATVWDVLCLPNGNWSNHQRIRQYTGGHNETWGGVTLNIDCDVLDGIVADVAGGDCCGCGSKLPACSVGRCGPETGFEPLAPTPLAVASPSGTEPGGESQFLHAATPAPNSDMTQPESPEGLRSWSHDVSAWSHEPIIYLAWSPVSDAEGGTAGYALVWDQEPDTEPEASVDLSAAATEAASAPMDTGAWYAHLRAVDAAGNGSETVHAGPFWIDVTPPQVPETGMMEAEWQSNPSPPALTWTPATDEGAGVVGYRLYWGADPDGAGDTVVTEPGWAPSAVADGGGAAEGYLRVAAVDGVGNESAWQTVVVWRYDPTPPRAWLRINSGGATSRSLPVTLHLSAEDEGSGVAEMRFSSDGQSWGEWEIYAPRRSWLLENRPQEQTVYTQVRDAAGNESDVVQATVTVDLEVGRPASLNYQLANSVMAMGGGYQESESYQVWGTAGQTTGVGRLEGSSYQVYSGFWRPVATEAAEVFVHRIQMLPFEPQPGLRLAVGAIRILDEGHAPVSGATVSANWTIPPSPYEYPRSATTNANGVAIQWVPGAWSGPYGICVTDVVKDGYLYNPDMNLETCDSIELP